MRVVHGLKSETRVIAVEVAVLDEILDGIDNLRIAKSVSSLQRMFVVMFALTFFRSLAFSSLASSIVAVCSFNWRG